MASAGSASASAASALVGSASASAAAQLPIPGAAPTSNGAAPGDDGPGEPSRSFIAAVDVTDDPGYVWKRGSSLRVAVLFDQHGKSDAKGPPGLVPAWLDKTELHWDAPGAKRITFGERFFDGLDACAERAGEIALGHTERQPYLALAPAGAYLEENGPSMKCERVVAARMFYKEGSVYDEKIGFTNHVVRDEMIVDVGVVRVTYLGWHCNDTGTHHVEIRNGTGHVVLRDTLTVEVFEYDLDGDGPKELYVLSEQACGGWLRVFRVTRQG